MFSYKTPKKIIIEKYAWQPENYPSQIEVTLRRSAQSRSIRILVKEQGKITVTGPLRVSKVALIRILNAKASWVLAKRAQFLTRGGTETALSGSAEEFQKYKKEALEFVKIKLSEWNKHYGFTYTGVTIRNQSTRWGSCSAKGRLSFHYRILFLPSHLADYLIVHELCHLKAFDHSPKFWALVSEAIPDYKECRKALKHNHD
jgi:predicted metal-dependent hydrolase